jgi:hypothetical protein
MLYSYLSQIKFVVEAKLEGGSFEDKYIAKFWQKLHVSLKIHLTTRYQVMKLYKYFSYSVSEPFKMASLLF